MLQTTVRDGIATVTLDHPPVNVLTQHVLAAFREALHERAGDPTVRALLLDACGKHFSAGADVAEHLAPQVDTMIPEFLDTVAALRDFPAPVIAAVQGKCLGGGFEIVQAADLVIAAHNATFGQPEIVLGVFPPAACALLAERCSSPAAAELILTGDPINADRAFELGLLTRVVPDSELASAAHELAERLASHSAAALRSAKRALRRASSPAFDTRLRAAGAIYLDELMETHDATEGLRAFLDKRQPVWTHQ